MSSATFKTSLGNVIRELSVPIQKFGALRRSMIDHTSFMDDMMGATITSRAMTKVLTGTVTLIGYPVVTAASPLIVPVAYSLRRLREHLHPMTAPTMVTQSTLMSVREISPYREHSGRLETSRFIGQNRSHSSLG